MKFRNKYLNFLFGFGIALCVVLRLSNTQATEINSSSSIPDPALKVSVLADMGNQSLTRGLQFYQLGQYQQALQQWQEAVQDFASKGQPPNQALGLSYVALAQKALGEMGAADQAIATALTLADPYGAKNPSLLAQAWNTQGSLSLAEGQATAAVDAWQKAQDWYAKAADPAGVLGAQLNEMQALQVLGYFRQASLKSIAIKSQLDKHPNDEIKLLALQTFGNLLQLTGTLTDATVQLEAALDLAVQQNNVQEQSRILNNLGNIYRQRTELNSLQKSQSYYQQAAAIAPNAALRVSTDLNYLSLLVTNLDHGTPLAATDTQLPVVLDRIDQDLKTLSLSRQTIEAQVNWAIELLKLQAYFQENNNLSAPLATLARSAEIAPTSIVKTLAIAIQNAQQLQDVRSESFAKGILASVYEQNKQWQEAQQLTTDALVLASKIRAEDIAYRWEWQLGRILQQSGGDRQETINAYQDAIQTLGKIRGDLLATNPEFQFSFRESVEPVYRELVSILIRPNSTQTELQQARRVIEGLQLVELENFFRSACIDLPERSIDQLDPKAAVVYPIILGDRLEVIRSLPGQPLAHHTITLGKAGVEATLEQLLQSLNPAFDDKYRLELSQKVYDWLIKPFDSELKDVDTLVFVLDGFFRSIPMAALYDGKHYLIEKYNVALAPGLQLVDPRSVDRQNTHVLALGLSESRGNFPALPGVKAELEAIAKTLPTKTVLDESFTQKNLRSEILATPFPILHLATHGQFSSNSSETFLLSWDGLINVAEFQSVIDERTFVPDQPIELLILSACETATGDKQAALGLAGFAVQSGARSTLATLWSVNDASTSELMTRFYDNFMQTSTVSRGKALRDAQLSLLNSPAYKHPYYWAPFVLVGNWL